MNKPSRLFWFLVLAQACAVASVPGWGIVRKTPRVTASRSLCPIGMQLFQRLSVQFQKTPKPRNGAFSLTGLLLLVAFAAAAQTNGPVDQFGESYTLHSKILNQDRPYWVCLPDSYQAKANRQRYPVLDVMDAEWNFYWVCPVLQFMEQSRQIPEFIVVGVPNIDREHDLTPTHDPNDPASGGGRERFARGAISQAAGLIHHWDKSEF